MKNPNWVIFLGLTFSLCTFAQVNEGNSERAVSAYNGAQASLLAKVNGAVAKSDSGCSQAVDKVKISAGEWSSFGAKFLQTAMQIKEKHLSELNKAATELTANSACRPSKDSLHQLKSAHSLDYANLKAQLSKFVMGEMLTNGEENWQSYPCIMFMGKDCGLPMDAETAKFVEKFSSCIDASTRDSIANSAKEMEYSVAKITESLEKDFNKAMNSRTEQLGAAASSCRDVVAQKTMKPAVAPVVGAAPVADSVAEHSPVTEEPGAVQKVIGGAKDVVVDGANLVGGAMGGAVHSIGNLFRGAQ